MPGLTGVFTVGPKGPAVFRRLTDRLAASDRTQVEALEAGTGTWAFGRAHLGVLHPQPQLSADDRVHVLFHGDLHNRCELQQQISLSDGTEPRLVAALYERDGRNFARSLKGQFATAVFDRGRGVLLLAGDRVGSYPLYYCAAGDGTIAFGPAVAPLVQSLALTPAVDIAATSSYFAFGFPFGTRTLHPEIRLVPAGTVLEVDLGTRRLETHRYWDAAQLFSDRCPSRREYERDVVDTFRTAVHRSLDGDQRFGLSLSGGLDSRAILSAVNGQASRLTTCTVGVDGCADQTIASALARRAGSHHQFLPLDREYLSDFLRQFRRMVTLTDGMYLSHGLTEMLALRFFAGSQLGVLLRGHGGELLKAQLAWPFHTDDRTATLRPSEFARYLLHRTDYVRRDLAIPDLFHASRRAEADGAPAEALGETIGGIELSSSDLCTYVYLREHHRRFTVASLELFRHAVEVRLPFVDDDVLAAVLRGSWRWRNDTTLHRAVIAACAPGLLRVRNSNTGVAADAGPLREALFDKVNTVLRRLHVPGFRHYHEFDIWMRRLLLDSVERVLLAPRCLDRRLWNEEAIRTAVDRTRRGVADYGYLLQVMLNVELWLQECES